MNITYRTHKTFYEKMQEAKAEKRIERERHDYRSDKGIARWWRKDGAWHIALPCPDVVDGLRTGGFMWTETSYDTRSQAVMAIEGKIERATRNHI